MTPELLAAMAAGRQRALEARRRADAIDAAADRDADAWHENIHRQAYVDLLRLRAANGDGQLGRWANER